MLLPEEETDPRQVRRADVPSAVSPQTHNETRLTEADHLRITFLESLIKSLPQTPRVEE